MDYSLSHGLCIYNLERNPANQLIGFVEGYEWYHGDSETVVVDMIVPGLITTFEMLQQVRQILEKCLNVQNFPNGMVTSRIEIRPNA